MAMIKLRSVDELPTVKQEEFGALPSIPQRTAGFITGSPWQSPEAEVVAAAIITLCIEAKAWMSVELDVLKRKFEEYELYRVSPVECHQALFKLLELGDIDIVSYGQAVHVVPKPTLTYKATREGSFDYRIIGLVF